MNRFFRFLFGFYKISFYSKDRERILNFILKKNIPVWSITREKDCISFFVLSFHFSHLKAFSEKLSPEERLEKREGGLLRLWMLFGKRGGFFLGAFIFFFMQYIATFFVWGIHIYGNDLIGTEVIRRDLSERGLYPGAHLSQQELDEIALRYQIEDDRFLYVNLNLVGTKVYAEVRERENFEKNIEEKGESNLVAERFGTVVRYEVLDGQVEVKVGDKVTEGTLLISGVRENKNGGFSAVRAKGRIFAETERIFEISIPYEQEEKVFTGEERVKKTYGVLGFSFSLPFGNHPGFESFETIEIHEDVTLFGKSLPVRKKEVIFLETKEKKEVVELDRAEKLAYDKYKEFIRETFAIEDEILEEKASFTHDESGVTLCVTVTAVEDICREIPFLYESTSS